MKALYAESTIKKHLKVSSMKKFILSGTILALLAAVVSAVVHAQKTDAI